MDLKDVLQGKHCYNYMTQSSWWLTTYFKFLVFACLLQESLSQTTCGGYYSIGSGSKTFYSPNYPSSYPSGINCVWLIESSSEHNIKLTFTFTGEKYNSDCSDYIQIRDGGLTDATIGDEKRCEAYTNEEVSSSNRWMSVQLRSDQLTLAGTSLSATAEAISNATVDSSENNRMPVCRSYQFPCKNHVCISMSYRCDDYNDCGCVEDCDEDGCGSLLIDTATQVAIAVTVGVFAFVCVCVMAYLIEGRVSWSSHKKKIIEQSKDYYVRRRASTKFNDKQMIASSVSRPTAYDNRLRIV